jgi:hypothetical protein
MLGLSIRFRKIGVSILQHFVLIAMTQLAREGAVLGAALIIGVRCVVFHRTFAYSFIRTS